MFLSLICLLVFRRAFQVRKWRSITKLTPKSSKTVHRPAKHAKLQFTGISGHLPDAALVTRRLYLLFPLLKSYTGTNKYEAFKTWVRRGKGSPSCHHPLPPAFLITLFWKMKKDPTSSRPVPGEGWRPQKRGPKAAPANQSTLHTFSSASLQVTKGPFCPITWGASWWRKWGCFLSAAPQRNSKPNSCPVLCLEKSQQASPCHQPRLNKQNKSTFPNRCYRAP